MERKLTRPIPTRAAGLSARKIVRQCEASLEAHAGPTGSTFTRCITSTAPAPSTKSGRRWKPSCPVARSSTRATRKVAGWDLRLPRKEKINEQRHHPGNHQRSERFHNLDRRRRRGRDCRHLPSRVRYGLGVGRRGCPLARWTARRRTFGQTGKGPPCRRPPISRSAWKRSAAKSKSTRRYAPHSPAVTSIKAALTPVALHNPAVKAKIIGPRKTPATSSRGRSRRCQSNLRPKAWPNSKAVKQAPAKTTAKKRRRLTLAKKGKK